MRRILYVRCPRSCSFILANSSANSSQGQKGSNISHLSPFSLHSDAFLPRLGTTRPTHYIPLVDDGAENKDPEKRCVPFFFPLPSSTRTDGCSLSPLDFHRAEELQSLCNSMAYAGQRCCLATSLPSPVLYVFPPSPLLFSPLTPPPPSQLQRSRRLHWPFHALRRR